MYGVIVSESSMNKYNIFADPLCFEIKNRRQGPKTAGYRRKPAAISNPGHDITILLQPCVVNLATFLFYHDWTLQGCSNNSDTVNDCIRIVRTTL